VKLPDNLDQLDEEEKKKGCIERVGARHASQILRDRHVPREQTGVVYRHQCAASFSRAVRPLW
jgi:hypothetical protein